MATVKTTGSPYGWLITCWGDFSIAMILKIKKAIASGGFRNDSTLNWHVKFSKPLIRERDQNCHLRPWIQTDVDEALQSVTMVTQHLFGLLATYSNALKPIGIARGKRKGT